MQIHATCPHRTARAARQKGVVLFIALIVLVALTLAGLALMRSMDTSNMVSGNLAFKQASIQAIDVGIEAAVAALPGLNANTTVTPVPGAAPLLWYYATRRATDASDIPLTNEYDPAALPATPVAINWTNVPVFSTVAGNNVQIVIDRLCTGPPPIVSVEYQCYADENAGGGSKAIGRPGFPLPNVVYYRVTVRVAGPRNTLSLGQAILSR